MKDEGETVDGPVLLPTLCPRTWIQRNGHEGVGHPAAPGLRWRSEEAAGAALTS